MIKITNPTETTQKFLDDISDATFDASELGGRRAKATLQDIAQAISDRNIAAAGSFADPASVQLTDEQWQQLHREVKVLASFSSESY